MYPHNPNLPNSDSEKEKPPSFVRRSFSWMKKQARNVQQREGWKKFWGEFQAKIRTILVTALISVLLCLGVILFFFLGVDIEQVFNGQAWKERFKPKKELVITGYVWDKEGRAIEGATVSVYDMPYEGVTDSTGYYRLELELSAGTTSIQMTSFKESFLPVVKQQIDIPLDSSFRETNFLLLTEEDSQNLND